MEFHVTVRYGKGTQRYHTFQVKAPEAAAALRSAARQIPAEIVPEVDLVEMRAAPDREGEGSLLQEGS